MFISVGPPLLWAELMRRTDFDMVFMHYKNKSAILVLPEEKSPYPPQSYTASPSVLVFKAKDMWHSRMWECSCQFDSSKQLALGTRLQTMQIFSGFIQQ